jgi:hypothetical protein
VYLNRLLCAGSQTASREEGEREDPQARGATPCLKAHDDSGHGHGKVYHCFSMSAPGRGPYGLSRQAWIAPLVNRISEAMSV